MDKITVTKDEFMNAVTQEMISVMEDPANQKMGDSKLIFAMGGAAFAHSVMKRLFNDKDDDE